MSQITNTAEVKPTTSAESYGRAITAGLTLTAAVIAVAFLLTRPVALPTGGAGTNQLADGFLPGAMAAHVAAQGQSAQALADGWEARLVGPLSAAQPGRS